MHTMCMGRLFQVDFTSVFRPTMHLCKCLYSKCDAKSLQLPYQQLLKLYEKLSSVIHLLHGSREQGRTHQYIFINMITPCKAWGGGERTNVIHVFSPGRLFVYLFTSYLWLNGTPNTKGGFHAVKQPRQDMAQVSLTKCATELLKVSET